MTEDEMSGWHHRLDGREFDEVDMRQTNPLYCAIYLKISFLNVL